MTTEKNDLLTYDEDDAVKFIRKNNPSLALDDNQINYIIDLVYDYYESRGLLVQSGTLRRSIIAKITDRDSVLFQTTVPYAKIHNEGGTITVTTRMKKYFWWKYITIVGSKRPKAGTATTYSERFQRKKNGELRNNKRNYMAMKKAGSKITIPKRQFIGNHPYLEKLLKEIAEKNAIELIMNN